MAVPSFHGAVIAYRTPARRASAVLRIDKSDRPGMFRRDHDPCRPVVVSRYGKPGDRYLHGSEEK